MKKKQAFTLIELLVCVGIFGILTVAIGQFLTSFLMLKFNTETVQRIRSEGNYALDRIDFLVRNGITLPNVCCGLGDDDGCAGYSRAADDTNVLKTNTQGTVGNFFQRSQVRWEDPNVDGAGQLVLYQLGDTKHNGGVEGATRVALTTMPGGNDQTAWQVTDFTVECRKDDFTNGYVVTTQFDISYHRLSLNAFDQELRETFLRETAVRNTAPFEN